MLGLALFTVFCLAKAPPPPEIVDVTKKAAEPGDVDLYRAEVDRVHAGEDYYAVAAEELPQRGYPTRSVFNWRTPLPMWLIGVMPTVLLGKLLLCALALTVLWLAFETASREEPNIYRLALPLVVLLIGPLLPCMLGDLFVMPVLWAGVFIAISICAYGMNRPYVGVAAGLAAVFFRELALPYCVLSMAIALWQRRRGELLAWTIGLAGWVVFFGLHCWQVSHLISPDAVAHRDSWIQFGGLSFVLSTVQMNSCLLLMPTWVTGLYFVAAMFGIAGWNTPMGRRTALTLCLFAVAFSIVGHDFNRYWGMLFAPLLCFGVVRAPQSLVELWHAAMTRRLATA